MKFFDSLTKRDLLAASKFNSDVVREHAERLLAEERIGDAFELFHKLGDQAAVSKIKENAIRLADSELLWRIEHRAPGSVTREEWARCGDQAMSIGKYRTAAFVYRRLGEAEKLAAAEKEFTAPTAVPSPTKPPAA